MLKLKCAVQHYGWGKRGTESETQKIYSDKTIDEQVAKLYAASDLDVSIEDTEPYAELWMGTHPSGPSYITSKDVSLKSWIEEHEAALGKVVLDRFGKDLPFLFKILSVNTALSIQAHPDKSLAQKLHEERPHVYKDDNHKPEMTLALTPFEALCGFVSAEELHDVILQVPELAACIGKDISDDIIASLLVDNSKKEALKQAFRSVMTRDSDIVKDLIEKLVDRLKAQTELNAKEKLVIRLSNQYPGDVGIFAAYFLNYITLEPGQAIFLEANEPHAYLSGNCAEAMATSDNVVRAGLTPKLRDTEVLCNMLTYNMGMPTILSGDKVGDHIKSYVPPFNEFHINVVTLDASQETTLEHLHGPLIMLVFDGKAHVNSDALPHLDISEPSKAEVKKGDVYFLPSGSKTHISTTSEQNCKLFISGIHPKLFL